MDAQTERNLVVSELRSFIQIIASKGLDFEIPADAELDKLPLRDLRLLVSHARELARTPS